MFEIFLRFCVSFHRRSLRHRRLQTLGVQCHFPHSHCIRSSVDGWFTLCISQEIVSIFISFLGSVATDTVFLRTFPASLHVRTVFPVGLFPLQDMLHVWTKLQSETYHLRQLLHYAHLRHSYILQFYWIGTDCCTAIFCLSINGVFGKSTFNFHPAKNENI